ncbi:Fic family protein [Candidatus Wolfebacteria bacterium]|nr:Fic family protein [Candidatus Wolfebacteria bacterium]
MSNRPQTEEELQKREAVGVIRASRFVRKYAHSHKAITMAAICEIHKEIFREAWPEIAGKYRDENLKITYSKHLPPHHSEVASLMIQKDAVLQEKLKTLKTAEGIISGNSSKKDELIAAFDAVIRMAAWLHHTITFVHPFREGNGRTARLAANLILERYGMVGISVKIEKENKNRYRQALAQIDSMNDVEPLVSLIYDGLLERYEGVPMKYYGVKK